MVKSTFGSILTGVLFCSLIAAAPAHAGLVTVEVTGQVTSVSEYGGVSHFPTIGVDSLVTGYYRYDEVTPDEHPSAYNGYYDVLAFSLTFEDGSTISTADNVQIHVNNNSSGTGTVDEYVISLPWDLPSMPSPFTLTGAFAPLSVRDGSRIYRNDTTGLAWDSDDLPDPESVVSLTTCDDSTLSFGMLSSDGVEIYPYGNIKFELTDLSVVTVPVPGALGLVAFGLACAGWRRRSGSGRV